MTQPPQGPPSSWWVTVRAVLWSFLGLRRRKDFHEDVKRLNPLQVMAVGFILTFLFVILLMVIVNWIAG
jgi:hypothetical protein